MGRPSLRRPIVAGLLVALSCLAIAAAVRGEGPRPPLAAETPSPDAKHSTFSGYTSYWGSLHRHSGYSTDATCHLPDALFQLAWQSEEFDFMAITDHDDSLAAPDAPTRCKTPAPGQTPLPPEPHKWQKLKEAAERNTIDGRFVALHGFEWTISGDTHVNVINSADYPVVNHLSGFYDWLAVQPDRDTIYAQFNHPLLSHVDFYSNHYPNLDAVRPIFRACEAYATSDSPMDGAYDAFLRRGWKLGAVGYDDNHDYYSSHRTFGVWAEELTREGIMDALLQRRTFSAVEPLPRVHPSIATALKANGFWMGQTINAHDLRFEIYVRDPVRSIKTVELIAGRVGDDRSRSVFSSDSVGITDPHEFSWTLDYTPPAKPYDFYYLRVWQINEAGVVFRSSASAPIFVEYDPSKPTSAPSPTPSETPTMTPVPSATATPTLTATPAASATPRPATPPPVHLPAILRGSSPHSRILSRPKPAP